MALSSFVSKAIEAVNCSQCDLVIHTGSAVYVINVDDMQFLACTNDSTILTVCEDDLRYAIENERY